MSETPDEMKARWDAEIAKAKVPTEAEMRESKAEWPKTEDELITVLRNLLDRPHSYGTCVYAMSLAAVAAFNYVSHRLGVTGFQASCADLDIIRRTRNLKGPFGIMDANEMLYPQDDLRAKLEKWLDEWRPWAAEEAKKLLADPTNTNAHPRVVAHWESLVRGDA